MTRKNIDCRTAPNDVGCTLAISGEPDELVSAAAQHAVAVHGHADSPELREQLRGLLAAELGQRDVHVAGLELEQLGLVGCCRRVRHVAGALGVADEPQSVRWSDQRHPVARHAHPSGSPDVTAPIMPGRRPVCRCSHRPVAELAGGLGPAAQSTR